MTTRVLVYTRTTDYRHYSILAAVAAAVRSPGATDGFDVDATEDPAAFETRLDPYAAVVFLSTSGDVLTSAPARTRLAAYVEAGGGFVGVHAAACTEYDWPYYGELLGGASTGTRSTSRARPSSRTAGHPATEHLPTVWEFTDELVRLPRQPARCGPRPLFSADDLVRGRRHGPGPSPRLVPEQGAGRGRHRALGHAAEAYEDPDFRAHLLGGITWAAARSAIRPLSTGTEPAPYSPVPPDASTPYACPRRQTRPPSSARAGAAPSRPSRRAAAHGGEGRSGPSATGRSSKPTTLKSSGTLHPPFAKGSAGTECHPVGTDEDSGGRLGGRGVPACGGGPRSR